MFWGWMWGPLGLIIAVPILMMHQDRLRSRRVAVEHQRAARRSRCLAAALETGHIRCSVPQVTVARRSMVHRETAEWKKPTHLINPTRPCLTANVGSNERMFTLLAGAALVGLRAGEAIRRGSARCRSACCCAARPAIARLTAPWASTTPIPDAPCRASAAFISANRSPSTRPPKTSTASGASWIGCLK